MPEENHTDPTWRGGGGEGCLWVSACLRLPHQIWGHKGKEGHSQEGKKRCLGNRGCPVMQTSFSNKKVSLVRFLFLVHLSWDALSNVNLGSWGEVKSFFLNLVDFDCL